MRPATLFLTLVLGYDKAAQALQLDPTPPSLKGISVPETPGLLDGPTPIVIDQTAAIQLGKALFWDMNVGSDGVACATCHFHAGADRRTRNQLEPGSRHAAPSGQTFEKMASGTPGGVNHALRSTDFPLFRLQKPADKSSKALFSTDDVVSSAGTVKAKFQFVSASSIDGRDNCSPVPDAIFHLGSANTRQVSNRHAPTVINAAFNYRNFWDGRANNRFNGETVYGPRNPEAGVWEVRDGWVIRTHPLLENASLASQAVAPPVDDTEMACIGRSFHHLARKLIGTKPLVRQRIHAEDSVLASLRDHSGWGLDTRYQDLIQKSFAPRYWAGQGVFGGPGQGAPAYSMMEVNFAFFFALAIQLYESTLISDESPFDAPRDPEGFPVGFNAQQKRGMVLFNKAECDFCHQGPGFSLAEHPAVYSPQKAGQPPKLVDRRVLSIDATHKKVFTPLTDAGYANTGVTPNAFDPGLGGRDPMGNPLSISEQYLVTLANPDTPMIDPVMIAASSFSLSFGMGFKSEELMAPPDPVQHSAVGHPDQARIPKPDIVRLELAHPNQGRLPLAVNGAFKIPTLRNVELTGPYMHNGSMKSLEEVIDFYDRGGNVENREHFGTFVFPQHFTRQEKQDLKAFLLMLTDERVRWERAPFDHPSLKVANGHNEAKQHGTPVDRMLEIPETGRRGRSRKQGPLQPFTAYLQKSAGHR
jgi:cytochrome c peroxidase